MDSFQNIFSQKKVQDFTYSWQEQPLGRNDVMFYVWCMWMTLVSRQLSQRMDRLVLQINKVCIKEASYERR